MWAARPTGPHEGDTIRNTGDGRVEKLRPGTVLLHVGMMKTGTTALQAAASTRRTELLAAGVRYPGRALNHRDAAFAVGGKRLGWDGPNSGVTPGIRHWDALVTEVRGDPERVSFVSNELFAEFGDDVHRRVIAELGGAVHVLFTLRSLPAMVASSWQQHLKGGFPMPFEEWLDQTFDPAAATLDRVPKLLSRSRLASLVAPWASIVGPENVTCIVLDPDDRELVPRTVEDLLGLERGMLHAEPEGHLHNRSFTAPEAMLFQQANELIRQRSDVAWKDFERLMQRGAMKRILAERAPDPIEPLLEAPRWAIDRSELWAREQRKGLERLGVRVVGSLENLERRPEHVPEHASMPDSVPVDLAAAALAGMFEAAAARVPRRVSPPSVSRPKVPAPCPRTLRAQASAALGRTVQISGRDLALALVGRMLRRVVGRAGAGSGRS